MRASGDNRILERLVLDGVITAEQREAAINQTQLMDERVEEALLDVNAIDEPTLLKALAAMYRTRFVSTEKLAKADIDPRTLEKVPKKVAERENVFPVLWDARAGVLSVVTPDPENAQLLQELQLVSGAKEVRAFVGRPRAVRAAIAKAYNGDIHAFATLDRAAHQQFATMLDVYERNLVSEESMAVALAKEGSSSRIRVLSQEELESGHTVRSGEHGVGWDVYLETLNVLVSLVEQSRPDLRGHSAHVARLMRKIGERIGLSDMQKTSMVVAGYVHDLGKMGTYHLTALNAAEYEGHRTSAAKLYRAPARLLEAVQLPKEVAEAVEGMYERYDGKGLPDGQRGKDIPLGARLLAIADTYADLTQNPRNPFRKTLRPAQACEVLARYKQTIFDPNLVDLFKHTVTGEDLKARLLADRHKALIVDPDPEETTVLELRMTEQGFEVQQARNVEQALKLLEKGEFEIVISELDLEQSDGFALLGEARRHNWGKGLPWIFVTNRGGRTDAQRAFELGAADYMTKPISSDLLVAKAKQIIEREASAIGRRGVSGSLIEMGLPEIVQVLWHGRKTGSLKIRSERDSGEIHFVNGMVYNALWSSLRGEEAFYAMLRLTSGDFALDPNYQSPQQVVQASPEALLLEGMRRLDEEGR
jgi:response regulator RpfG family c-di-GMP phosphodiesterase